MTASIYSAADVARLLSVTPAAVSNYLARHDDTPAAPYATTDGRLFWDRSGMSSWLAWQQRRRDTAAARRSGDAHHARQGAARAADAIDALRDELAGD